MKDKCSDNFVIEPEEGLFRVCKHNTDKESLKEYLRAIASIRTTTCVLIESVCDNHKGSHHDHDIYYQAIKEKVMEDIKDRIRGY